MRLLRCAAWVGFLLTTADLPAQEVAFRRHPGKIDVTIGGTPFTTFHHGEPWLKPFLHPLRAPSGTLVSRGFPLEKIAGESTDHPHHRGLWYAHGDINGFEFWNEPNPAKKGRKPFGRMALMNEPVTESGRLRADLDLIPIGQFPLGTLREEFTFARAGAAYVIEAAITLSANRGQPLRLGDTEEGALGIRLRDEFRQDRGATLLNADGLVGTEKIWGKRAKWVDYSTTVQGETLGVAILDHPGNPKHPTYWHARGYGLCAANPFGERDFHKDKRRDGSMVIPEGGSLSFRYRVLMHTGDAKTFDVSEQYDEFTRQK